MYKVNDTVLYGTQGVCIIEEISEQNFGGSRKEYYMLKPVYDKKSTIFIPVHMTSLTSKMRSVLSEEEVYSLIHSMPNEDSIWIDDAAVRKEHFKKILEGNSRRDLVRLIKTLYQRQQEQRENGKKLYVADDRFLKEAEKLLHEEFALVLNITREQVLPFILDEIQVNERN